MTLPRIRPAMVSSHALSLRSFTGVQCCNVTPLTAASTAGADGLKMRRMMFLGLLTAKPCSSNAPCSTRWTRRSRHDLISSRRNWHKACCLKKTTTGSPGEPWSRSHAATTSPDSSAAGQHRRSAPFSRLCECPHRRLAWLSESIMGKRRICRTERLIAALYSQGLFPMSSCINLLRASREQRQIALRRPQSRRDDAAIGMLKSSPSTSSPFFLR
jgi:hypothetical protein